MYPQLTLTTLDIPTISARHPWVLKRQIEPASADILHGSLITLCDPDGNFIGNGTYSAHGNISIRLLTRQQETIDRTWLVNRITEANNVRLQLGYGPNTNTTGYRVLFGEADFLPGLVIDRFDNSIVFQIATAGIDNLRNEVITAIQHVFSPSVIVERSEMPVRKEERLEPVSQLHVGESAAVTFLQHGVRFSADLLLGQKTGFFLDQGTLRQVVTKLARNKSVLNLFSYTGGFTVAALAGGAKGVINVDSSQSALDRIPEQLSLNNLTPALSTQDCSEAFDWLSKRNDPEFDMVILDPPALIKSKQDAASGRKGYHFLNRAALRLVKDGGILVTSSCSAHFSEDDFLITLRRASMQAGISLRIVQRVYQNPDHPIVPYFLDGSYLKSFVCTVNRP